MGKPLDSFKTLHETRLYRKLMQILNDPTHTRHYFDSRRSNRSGRFLLLRTNTNRYKVSFLPSAPSVFNDNYVIKRVCACVRTTVEDTNLPREGGGCESFCFGLSEITLFQIILVC